MSQLLRRTRPASPSFGHGLFADEPAAFSATPYDPYTSQPTRIRVKDGHKVAGTYRREGIRFVDEADGERHFHALTGYSLVARGEAEVVDEEMPPLSGGSGTATAEPGMAADEYDATADMYFSGPDEFTATPDHAFDLSTLPRLIDAWEPPATEPEPYVSDRDAVLAGGMERAVRAAEERLGEHGREGDWFADGSGNNWYALTYSEGRHGACRSVINQPSRADAILALDAERLIDAWEPPATEPEPYVSERAAVIAERASKPAGYWDNADPRTFGARARREWDGHYSDGYAQGRDDEGGLDSTPPDFLDAFQIAAFKRGYAEGQKSLIAWLTDQANAEMSSGAYVD